MRLTPAGAHLTYGSPDGPFARVDLQLIGASRSASPVTFGPSESIVNYLTGNQPSQWRTGIPAYDRVGYRGIYPGIDLIYYGQDSQLEYDFQLAPGADPRTIRLRFHGASQVTVDSAGDLVVSTAAGEIRHHRPTAYQESAGIRREVPASYDLRGNQVGFRVGAFDHSLPLVIDPVITYSTLMGATRADAAFAIAADAAGNVVVAGRTYSTDLRASTGAFQTSGSGYSDIFISKFDSRGTLVFTTYFGGNDDDLLAGVALDGSGNIYIAGYTTSTNLPTSETAMQRYNRGGSYLGTDAYVAKLDPTGARLIYGTYVGGNDDELTGAIAVDRNGLVYITGATASANFPVSASAYQKVNRSLSTFVSKLDAQGAQLTYSTFVGGRLFEMPHAIAIDSTGAAYVAGYTASSDFPTTPDALQTTFRGGSDVKDDAFVYKLDPLGTRLVYSTLLGGTGDDYINALAIDAAGNAYVAGSTMSSNFPLVNPFQNTLLGPDDTFLAKINPTGTALVFSTFFGGTRSDSPSGLVLDSAGNIYLAGTTTSTSLPVVAPTQPAAGGASDGYLFKFDPAAAKVLQGTMVGGAGEDVFTALAADGAGNLYVAGWTDGSDFPVTTPTSQAKFAGETDGLMLKLNFADSNLVLTAAPGTLAFQGSTSTALAHQSIKVSCVTGAFVGWKADVSPGATAWLSVSPRSGSGPGTIDVAANTAGLAAGTYSGSILVVNQVTGATTTITVSLNLVKQPDPGGTIPSTGVLNAASFLPGPLAPGEFVTIFGNNIGPATLVSAEVAPDGTLAKTLSETRILFDGVPAPLLYVSAGQVSAIVPYAVSGKGTTVLQAEYKGLKSNTLTLPVAECAPAIFTADSSGKGQAAIANQDGTYNSKDNPADKNSVVTFFATGEGDTNPAGVDGRLALSAYPKPILPVSVQIGGVNAEVLYYGAAPQAVAGDLQLNVRIPDSVVSGSLALVLKVGACSSPANVTIAVR